ncbi:MAG: response regulator [Polyangiaceae bacterium]
MASVLIIEDEALLRASMARLLARQTNVEVFDAGTLREGILLLEAYPPDLILADLDLPDGSGVAVLTELERLGLAVPVVFITDRLSEFRARLPERAGVQVLEKPVSRDLLRRTVLDHLRAKPEREPFGVLDYLQLAGIGRRSVAIEVAHPQGEGRILVQTGEVWSAFDQRGGGQDAFRRLLRTDAIVSRCLTPEGPPGPRTIFGTLESLLMQAFGSSPTPAPGPLTDRPSALRPPNKQSVAPAPLPATFPELLDLALESLLTKRFAEAYRYFDAAGRLQPDAPIVIANLRRLREMGFATKSPTQKPPRRS